MSLRRNVQFFVYKEIRRFLQPSRWLVESIIKDIGVDRTPVLLSGTAVNGSSLLDDYEAELKITADFGGMGFAQNIIIHDGKVQPLFRSNTFQHRALCELEGRICIIQSDAPMPYILIWEDGIIRGIGCRHRKM